jgi:cell division protein ZapE
VTAKYDLRELYRRELSRHGYRADAAQEAAVARLEELRSRLLRRSRRSAGWRGQLRRLLRPLTGRGGATPLPGVYLWGGVGRGKTFLLDLFYASLQVPAQRQHFHRFMQDVHAALRRKRELQTADPLAEIAAEIAATSRVLCFDELYVSDIADAMLLSGLFTGLIEGGVTLVFTSNVPPSELYRDGLQRQRFLPTIALLERHTHVLQVDAGHDYRLRELERAPLYFAADDPDSEALLEQRFRAIAGGAGQAGGHIEIEQRQIAVRRRAADVIWFDFAALCEGPRSQVDYIELARSFHAVIVSSVPQFDAGSENAARRFIALVDEFYDRGVKLVVSAAAAPEALYRGDRHRFEFARTASRLAEMQTHAYLERPHQP